MKYALIIGNDRYDDAKLAQLKTPAADSQALAKTLGDETIGSFDEVTPLINQTETQVRRAISTFLANKKPDDLILLYFSGHGVLDDRGRLYLALKDTQIDLLKATSIPSSFVADEMDSCRSKRQILILDCCHSGAFARGTKGEQKAITEMTFEGSGFGRVVLTASDSTQYALEGDQVIKQTELSLFTHFLLEGLKTGEADTNNDGQISLDEWYDYTYARVISETPRQVPHKWSYNQRGDLLIAKNPHRKKKIAELPRELLHALESSFVGIRESAVNELGNLLRSSDPEMAALAAASLEKMKQDDSRRISSLAETLLSEFEQARAPVKTTVSESIADLEPVPEDTSLPLDKDPASTGFVFDRFFWSKWIGAIAVAVVLSMAFFFYSLSADDERTALPVILFTVVTGVSGVVQWFLFKDKLPWWVAGNLAAGLTLGLLHNFLYNHNSEWWDTHLSILLTIWVIGNFAFGLFLLNQQRAEAGHASPILSAQNTTNWIETKPYHDPFYIFIALSLLLFFLAILSGFLSLTSEANIFTVLLGVTNILVGILFLLKKDVPRNFGFITLAVSWFLFGIFIELQFFTPDFPGSLYAIPGFFSLLSGIFFVTQKETNKDVRFVVLSGFLLLRGIANIGSQISVVYDSFILLSAFLALVTAVLFFRGK